MRPWFNFILLATLVAEVCHSAFAAPIEFVKTSDTLDARDSESPDGLGARELLYDIVARGWDDPAHLSSREVDNLVIALRSLSDDELIAFETRGLKGIVKLAKAAVTPIKKLTSAIRPGGSSTRKAPSPAPAAAKRPKKSSPASGSKATSSKTKSSKPSKAKPKSTSKGATKKPNAGKSGQSNSSKKGSVAKSSSKKKGSKSGAKNASGSSGKGASSKGTGKTKSHKKAPGSKGGKVKKGSNGKGKDNKKGKGKGKKSSKKPSPPSRTRNRTFNVNLDPGTLLNAGAAIANVVTGLAN